MSSKYGTFYLGLLTEASYLMPQIFSSVLVPKEGHACRDCSVAQDLTKQAFALQLHCGSRKVVPSRGKGPCVWEAHLQGLKMRLRVLELIVYYFSIIVCLAVSLGTLGGAPRHSTECLPPTPSRRSWLLASRLTSQGPEAPASSGSAYLVSPVVLDRPH